MCLRESNMIFTHRDYTVAWICALPLEVAAAKALLDEVHRPLQQPKTDHNVYTLGTVSGHNLVVACLPSGVYGMVSASTVVSHMVSTFPNIQFGLMVGIGGGVPSKSADIRLGDVVVSKPTAASPGVIQYDYGKTLCDGRFQRTGTLNKPPLILLKAMAQIESDYLRGRNALSEIIEDALKRQEIRERFSRPECDWLFRRAYKHEGLQPDCSECDQAQVVDRPLRSSDKPCIHYGLIASGDQVMKDARTRDAMGQELDILCFEMEAAGLMDELPSLVIRGISDYCDSHKNKQWQGYAALAAAAYAKTILSVVPAYRRNKELHQSRKPVWMVPFRRNSQFVGREEEIARIGGLVMKQDGPSKVAICGLGGVGKTQIALELGYRITRKVTADVQGEILDLKDTINGMVDRLNRFASGVSRVAHEVGTDGVEGQWKDLTDNINTMAHNLTSQVRAISNVTQKITRGDRALKLKYKLKAKCSL
jgi:nucleoside phosphorylase